MKIPRDKSKRIEFLHERLKTLPEKFKTEIRNEKFGKTDQWLNGDDQSKEIYYANLEKRQRKKNNSSPAEVLETEELLQDGKERVVWSANGYCCISY